MAVFQLTVDRRWLGERYRVRPARGVNDNDCGGLDPAGIDEIRDLLPQLQGGVVEWSTCGTRAVTAMAASSTRAAAGTTKTIASVGARRPTSVNNVDRGVEHA
jgi:hypothetical protein